MKPVLAAHMTDIKSSKGSTNGPWTRSRHVLWHRHNTRGHAERGLGVCCRMAVLNDFEANGYGVTALDEHHVVVLNDVPATEKVSVSQYQHCPANLGMLLASLKHSCHQQGRVRPEQCGVEMMSGRCRVPRQCWGREQGWERHSCSGMRFRGATRCGPAKGPTLGLPLGAGSKGLCRQDPSRL